MAEKAQEWFRPDEAVKYLAISRTTLWRAVRAALIAPQGKGRARRFRRADLDALPGKLRPGWRVPVGKSETHGNTWKRMET